VHLLRSAELLLSLLGDDLTDLGGHSDRHPDLTFDCFA